MLLSIHVETAIAARMIFGNNIMVKKLVDETSDPSTEQCQCLGVRKLIISCETLPSESPPRLSTIKFLLSKYAFNPEGLSRWKVFVEIWRVSKKPSLSVPSFLHRSGLSIPIHPIQSNPRSVSKFKACQHGRKRAVTMPAINYALSFARALPRPNSCSRCNVVAAQRRVCLRCESSRTIPTWH